MSDDAAADEQAVRSAQSNLAVLREFCDLPNAAEFNPCVRLVVSDGEASADLWLRVIALDGDGFVAAFDEVPPELTGFAPGDAIPVAAADVLDWMVNDDGDLHGGYSLRLERSRLPAEERAGFDQALGARRYV